MEQKKVSDEDDKRIDDIVFHERIKILYDHLLSTSIPAHLICATILFIGLFFQENKPILLAWYASSFAVSFLRLYFLYLYRREPTKGRLHLKLFIIGSSISALTWTIAGTVLISEVDMNGLILIIIIITGITAGASQTLQASLTASAIFMVLVILPLIIFLILDRGQVLLVLSIGVTAYMAFMLKLVKNGYTQLTDSIKLRHINILLAKQLSVINKNLMKTQEQLNYLATHDVLTQIPNLHYFNVLFQQTMGRAQRQSSKFSVLFVDVDHFKSINDTYGHDTGDQLLYQIASLFKKNLRTNETVARIGGDEFIILLEDVSGQEYTENFITRLCNLFKTPFHINDHELLITLTIGVSIYPNDGEDKQILMKNADLALYQAKKMGRNRAEFYHSTVMK